MESTYKVIYSGEVLDGFSLNEVEINFAKLFGISVEQVAPYLKPGKVIKKDLAYDRANVYKQKLEKIGLNIILEEEYSSFAAMELELEANLQQAQSEREHQERPSVKPTAPVIEETNSPTIESTPATPTPKSFDINSLSVMGMEDANINDEQAASSTSNMGNGGFSCPKCGTQQPKSDQCVNFSCGVYFSKFKQAQEQSDQFQNVKEDDSVEEQHEDLTLVDKLKPIIGGYIAAIISIVAWIYLSVKFEITSTIPVILVGLITGYVIQILNDRQRDLRVIAAGVTFSALLIGTIMGINVLKGKGVTLLKEQMAMVENVPQEYQEEVYRLYAIEFKKYRNDIENKEFILSELHQMIDMVARTQSDFDEKDADILKRFFNDYFYEYTYDHYMKIYNYLENENPSTYELSKNLNNFTYEYIEGYSSIQILKAIMTKLDWLLYLLAAAAAFQLARPKY